MTFDAYMAILSYAIPAVLLLTVIGWPALFIYSIYLDSKGE